ncbi:prepilin-type N-terminal cleavage/methylation domain-containing protein [Janthinobacterium lividum]|uniref:Prepilin-type N-terminal cleavage/methylation domain-containing protein n=1 Tax=Janthinobacterium lividum TaxID=29581 RepID=A0ABU0XNY3_9BURK|nr:prepilin-type N-terminal cleavage/methylation domain-containing protein [Janthinobacterium lividum]MDQ4625222.1 prepilin-type N-terminal cleavage/methylation domain-containing protein [Janthinobacterium lividum]MDQ4673175.1 prepilin-type N-terminal cleavage/methylation domain-containing protein [Janthinobacterium lividum]MDQ4683904.1 prepilin-type N-terminal cleavage/methylation domain-containing protein [Janthinobacterium lividum]
MTKFLDARRLARGFTLVEMVIVIVITGIIGTMVAVFIRVPVQGYMDVAARAALADTADTAARRLTRDVRLALPNSVRVSNNGLFLELLLTKTGGRYLSDSDPAGLGNVLSFETPPAPGVPGSFSVVGAMPANALGARQAISVGDQIVVYNLGGAYTPNDAYSCSAATGCNRAAVTGVAGNVVTLGSYPFATAPAPLPSPSNRFQVVSTPVTYACDLATGTLTRYAGYAIQATQPVAADLTDGALLARQVTGCAFSYTVLANVQRGLVNISLSLGAANSNTGVLRLVQQVQARNTP